MADHACCSVWVRVASWIFGLGKVLSRRPKKLYSARLLTPSPDLAILLSIVRVSLGNSPGSREYEQARELVHYLPDVRVLAEAICASPDWFVTLDRKHFLENRLLAKLPFQIGTPGDFLEAFKENLK